MNLLIFSRSSDRISEPIFAIGMITWLAILENSYHPWIYRCSQDVSILEVGEGELELSQPPDTFNI